MTLCKNQLRYTLEEISEAEKERRQREYGRNFSGEGREGGRTLKATGEVEAGEVDGDGRRSGERRTLYGTRCFRYAGTETGGARVVG